MTVRGTRTDLGVVVILLQRMEKYEELCVCEECGEAYLTNIMYRVTDKCVWCSGAVKYYEPVSIDKRTTHGRRAWYDMPEMQETNIMEKPINEEGLIYDIL